MPTVETIASILGTVILILPCAQLAVLGASSLLDRALPEQAISRSTQFTMVAGLLASLAMLGLMLLSGARHVTMSLGDWVHVGHFHFAFKFVFDRLSIPFVILTFLLCGTISAFANRYLHREPGYNRFFVLFGVFALGMITTSLAGTIETLFSGWELVGVSSALLVAFFHERQNPVRNGLRVWSVYRASDAALLIAAVVLHHLTGAGDFDKLLGVSPGHEWPFAHCELPQHQALTVGLLLLLAAAGKSALIPFCGWLPRAMEGPTPSSAIYYGALSVHLGAFLLLRFSPVIEDSLPLAFLVAALGLATSLFAAITGRVQSDIKSALSFASLTQVGLIVGEIGIASAFCSATAREVLPQAGAIGVALKYIALVHVLGHACLRTLQFLRASTILQDLRLMENAVGGRLSNGLAAQTRLPIFRGEYLYRLALQRGNLDAWLSRWFVQPVLKFFQRCDHWERRWTDWLSGGPSRFQERPAPLAGSLEDLS